MSNNYCVIVPTRTDTNILPCLTQLRKHEPTCPVVIVDDGLSIQAIDQARFCEPISFTKGLKPFNHSTACNLGMDSALMLWPDVEGFCFSNDDALLETDGGFSLMAETCKTDPSIGCIGAVTDLTGQPLQRPQGIGLRDVPHIAYVCVYIPRTTIELLAEKAKTDPRFTRGMDERYVNYGSNDLDGCMQIEAAGLRVCVLDDVFVNHSKLHSSYRGSPETPGDIWPNHRLLRAKWGLGPNPMDPQQGGAR